MGRRPGRACAGLLLATAFAASARAADPDDRGLQFSQDWVSPHQEVWSEVLAPLVGRPGLNYLEIGLWEGRSFLWMLDHILTHPSSRATGIDPFRGTEHERTFRSNVRKAGYQDRVTLLLGTSKAMLRRLPPRSFDLIYVDGSHKASDVLLDAGVSWTLLKKGGILIFDDYAYVGPVAERPAPDELIPRAMIDAFLTANRSSLQVLHRGYQMIVQKTADPCVRKWDCVVVGQYLYRWSEGQLERQGTGENVELSAEERDSLETFVRSRGFGQVDFDFARGAAESAAFGALARRLGLLP